MKKTKWARLRPVTQYSFRSKSNKDGTFLCSNSFCCLSFDEVAPLVVSVAHSASRGLRNNGEPTLAQQHHIKIWDGQRRGRPPRTLASPVSSRIAPLSSPLPLPPPVSRHSSIQQISWNTIPTCILFFFSDRSICSVIRLLGFSSRLTEMSDSEEHHFESRADAGASKTYPQQAGTVRKNGYVVIKNRPCKVPLHLSPPLYYLCRLALY
jgi:hypothetical protein